jgi:hypothetical protein
MISSFSDNIINQQRHVDFEQLIRDVNDIQVVYVGNNGNISHAAKSKGLHMGRVVLGYCKDIDEAQALCNKIINEAQK